MPFVNPALFAWGAAAASVPIVIHILNRRRFKVRDWAAMRFLMESIRQNRRRIQLEELILLALRCLAILLLALAVGRFLGFAPSRLLPVGTAAQTTHVFILDDSVSMGQKLADTNMLSKAANDLSDTLTAIPTTDRVAVVLTSRPGEALFPLGVLTDRDSIVGRLKSLQPSDTTAQIAKSLAEAARMFGGVTTEKRLYLFSDFRKTDFSGPGVEEIRNQLRALRDAKVELSLLSYGAGPGPNLTAEDFAVADKIAVAGQPVRVQLRVRNNGPARVENVAVRLVARSVAGEESKVPAKEIKGIDPGAAETLQVTYAFPDTGSALLEAHLPGDTLPGDNDAYLAVDVRAARRVLIVDGEPDLADPALGESYFLASALDPKGNHADGNQVEIVTADHLLEIDFNRYDAVILANVSEFPATGGDSPSGSSALDNLTQYVEGGGGLAIFTGGRVNLTYYNDKLHKGGTGLCPLRLLPPVGDATARRESVRLDRDSIANDPVMRAFQGRMSEFTQMVRFYEFHPAEIAADVAAGGGLGPVRVLARFNNTATNPQHSPAIVARQHGAGTVMMICTTADKAWSDWPKDMTFVVFANDMLQYLCRPAAGDFTGPVGRRIDYGFPIDLASARATLQTPKFPAEDLVSLKNVRQGGRQVVTYDQTRHAGAYRLELATADAKQTVLFARNIDPLEGRLEVAPEADLRGQLGVDFGYVDKLAPAPAATVTASTQQEYWKAALVAMLIVLALEVFLGQRFGHYETNR